MADPSAVPRIDARPSVSDFFRGAALPFRAGTFIFRSPRLFVWSAISAVVTLITLVALVWLLVTYTDDLVSWAWPRPDAWYGQAAWYAVLVLTFLGLLAAGANTLPLALQAPLQDVLSEATEEQLGGFKSPPFSFGALLRGVSVSVAHTLARIAILIGGHLVLFALNLLPGVGSVLWTVTSALWTMVWVAAEYIGSPMARHLYPFSVVSRVVRSRPALSLGFGAAVYVILWVPILNLFFIPMAVVGGTLLFRGLLDGGLLPPSPVPSKAAST